MESITAFFKEENDPLFEKGEAKGFKKGRKEGKTEEQEKFVINLIKKSGWPDEQIADVAGVSLAFVKKNRKQLNGKIRQ